MNDRVCLGWMRRGEALTLMSWISRSTGAKFSDFSMGISFPQEHAGSASVSRAPASGRRCLSKDEACGNFGKFA